jgi:molybdenum cofactor cytidylyltransferase
MAAASGVCGVVLAAGESRRMGRPKALLPCPPDGETFVARVVGTLLQGGVQPVLVVGRRGDTALYREVGRLGRGAAYVVNPAAEEGQLSSVLAGLEAADRAGATAILLMPVDVPQVRPGTIASVLRAFALKGASIVRATHQGRHGHPVLFARAVFEELRTADPGVGARAVVHADAGRVLNLEVDDPGVLRDFDRPAEYEAWAGSAPPEA